jgi:signal transduction histidine kinase
MPPHMRRKRQRSIRALLIAIFIVPLASLLGLWGFAASVTVSNAIQEHNFNTEDRLYGGWAQSLFRQLAQERLQAYEWLSAGPHGSDQAYLAQQRATDVAVSAFRKGLSSGPPIVPAARPALASFNAQLAWLNGIRRLVETGTISAITAFTDYNQIVDSEFDLYADLVVVNNTPLYMQAAASVEAGRSVELASREVTLVTGAILSGARMGKAEHILFAQTAATRQYLMADALRQLDPSLGSGYQRADASQAYNSFAALEAGIVRSLGSKRPVPGALAFGLGAAALFKQYEAAEVQDRFALSNLGTQVGNRLLREVGLAGGAGLLAVALSVFLMVRFGRRISRDLTGLQHAALDLADERLPRVVARLSQGEVVDVTAEAAPLAEGRIAETARVAAAFSSVQRTAVEAAVGQARLRAGVAQVFRSLAWRSQSLLHRQLTLLDGMERRSSEPEALDELFQLDHLTTRMRRHAEGLIILSGATPGRGWREPVPVVDVLRGAIAEIEDYKRVAIICESQDAVIGSAVADVIHLLAELIENATTCSPPSTEVTIRAERVANGFVVEIDDRGIGMGAAEMAMFNERLANPPDFEIADSNRLGLFVVARLAGKHQIRITLRASPYGGTSAIVLLPQQIVAVSDGAVAAAVRVAGNGRELISTGRQLPGNSPDHGRNGRELAGNGRDHGGNSGELASSTGREAAGDGREPASNDPEPVGAGREPDGAGAAHSDSGPQRIDVVRTEMSPASTANGAAEPSPAPGNDRLAPDVTAEEDSGWSDSPVWRMGAAAGSNKPGLPRRVRQASLAPQLRTEVPTIAEDAQVIAGEAEDANGTAPEGPNPADTQALVQSLQFGLELARATDEPADESWPPPASESWSTSASGPWPSPAGNPDLANRPEDNGGQ